MRKYMYFQCPKWIIPLSVLSGSKREICIAVQIAAINNYVLHVGHLIYASVITICMALTVNSLHDINGHGSVNFTFSLMYSTRYKLIGSFYPIAVNTVPSKITNSSSRIFGHKSLLSPFSLSLSHSVSHLTPPHAPVPESIE
jgi:hypothetical protein